ncbi:hypothetical protein FHT98_0608 [Bosea sp. AK1]|uniref:glycine-rich domain-containing protein n=1 Tax=Bosea sp. AK1 TaxID=2587160 RepID=UPI00114F3E25|nr:hypothetical protein [Bosea sp. AK1]TQI72888.1 hypothetical protein FHT98_0608 [Bosea sp. AK1]
MATISLPFAASATKRAPDADELANGYGCGDADLQLFDWLAWWLTGQVAGAVGAAGLTVDDTNIARLANAIQKGMNYVVATGTANAWVLGPSLAPLAYAAGLNFDIIAPATNTSTSVTANISSLGTKSIKRSDGADPQVGDLVVGTLYRTVYDGTNIRISGQLPSQAKAASFKVSRVIFSTPGPISWTVLSGVTRIRIKDWGGGGGGGFGNNPSGPAGGGAGAYFEWSVDVAPGDIVTGTVGAGGAAGFSGNNGANGGASSVTVNGQTRTASGGTGGTNAGGSAVTNSAAGGIVTGTVDYGRDGSPSGGGQQGYSGSGILFYAGRGGDAPNGGYGGNAGTGAGNPGLIPGGGGGAGASGNAAGAGARGEIWIEY